MDQDEWRKEVKRREQEVYDRWSSQEHDGPWDNSHYESLQRLGADGWFWDRIEREAGDGNVLFLGCGDGHNVTRTAQLRDGTLVVGIDISAGQFRDRAREGLGGEFVHGDAEFLPFDTDSFDTVVARSALHHLPAWEREVMDEVVRVLSPGGSFVLYEPGKYNPPAVVRRKLFPSKCHTPDEHPFDPAELEAVLERHFTHVDLQGHYVFSNLFPVLDRYLPFSLPVSLTKRVYAIEQRLPMNRRLSWVLTGIARTPDE